MNETTLIDQAAAALGQLGIKVAAMKQPRDAAKLHADAWLRVRNGKDHIEYPVEARKAVTPTTLGAVLAQLRQWADAAGRPALLITEYLTPPLAEKLRTHGQQFADAAGNVYLNAPGLLIYITGRKPTRKPAGLKARPAFAASGLKVLFALICDPPLVAAPHRAIAAAAGVALGAVPGVVADLRQAGHLLVVEKRRRLNANKRLLDDWAFAYAQRLRPKTLVALYTTADFAAWREWQLDPREARWGAEPAAHLLVRHLTPGVLTIYGDKLPPKLMIERRLVQAGPLGTERLVELRKPFWGAALRAEARPDTVPPALVYADLLATGDARCIETADMVYDRYLARLLPAA